MCRATTQNEIHVHENTADRDVQTKNFIWYFLIDIFVEYSCAHDDENTQKKKKCYSNRCL